MTNITDFESGQSRILIVDDNPRIHRDFELVLLEEPENPELAADEERVFGVKHTAKTHQPDYILEHAHSGQESIDKIKQGLAVGRLYQLAFVDIRMPGLDGVATVEQIWRVDPKIQVVICTAYADYSQDDLVQRLGRTDKLLVLKKPFDSIEVTQLARTLTEKWHLARQAALKLEQMELLVSQRTRKILEMQRREVQPTGKSESAPRVATSNAPAAADTTKEINLIDPADAEFLGKKSPLILVVASNATTNVSFGQALADDYEITETPGGQIGLEKAQSLVPDIVIVSGATPDDVDFCRKLKASPLTSHVPVILFGANVETSQLKALDAGADDYFTKPADTAALKLHIENLLESQRQLTDELRAETTLQPRDLAANQADALFLQRIIGVIEQNMSDFEFDVDALARNVAVSRRQLFRKLKAVLNTTPKALIRSVRLKRAAQLLTESNLTVTEITFAVGFLDVKHFRTLFKEQFGALPSEYIKKSDAPVS
ncbi:MAG TPA: helix-turn-helix domain-containing protein [Verrucomicrobiae bacterium]|jgi:CheY-like chemotaxis protein